MDLINLMKRILLLILIVTFNYFNSGGQTYFQYQYGSNFKDEKNNKGLLLHNNLYILSQINDITYFSSSLRLVKFDSLMNIETERGLVTPGASRTQDISGVSDSTFIITGLSIDTLNFYNKQSTVVSLLNSFCDTIWATRLNLDSIDVTLKYVHTIGDTIVLFGTIGNFQSEVANPAFIKINKTNGNFISGNNIILDNTVSFSRGLKCIYSESALSYFSINLTFDTLSFDNKLSIIKYDNNLVPITGYYLNGNSSNEADIINSQSDILLCCTQFNPIDRDAIVLKFDSTLNLIWSKIYSSPYDDTFQNIRAISNDSTIILSKYGSIEEIDFFGNLIGEKTIIDPTQFPFTSLFINDIIPLTDTSIITLSARKKPSTLSFDLVINKANKNGSGCSNLNSILATQNINTSMQPILFNTTVANVNQNKDISLSIDSTVLINECSTFSSTELISSIEKVDIYPNPFTNTIHINLSFVGNYKISIYNCHGQIVRKINLENSTSLTIELTDLSQGLYLIEVLNEQTGISMHSKIIKT